MRILHIFDHSIPLHSGYTFRSRAILEQQRALGWETFHLTSPKHYLESPERETVDGLTFYRTPKSTGVLSRLPIINQLAISSATAKRLEQIIPEIKPDILHAHSPALNGLAALRAGKKFNLPVVYEIRAFWEDAAVDHGTSREGGLRYRLTRRMETHVIKQANAVTTICEGLRRDIIGRGVPDTRVTVIPNAVDISRFSVGDEPDQHLQQELGLAGKQVLGFIGSFYAYEGLPLLLEALPKILEKNPDIRVLLVGGGPDEGKLRTQCVQLNIADKVIFTGRVPHEAVNKYYDLIDILVYPRYSMRLTELVTPLKPLEAMAQGRLLVASDVGGHHELIRDGETGQLFKAGNAAALAEAVLELLANEKYWPAIRAAARRFVETERNWPVSVARYEKIYTGLLT